MLLCVSSDGPSPVLEQLVEKVILRKRSQSTHTHTQRVRRPIKSPDLHVSYVQNFCVARGCVI